VAASGTRTIKSLFSERGEYKIEIISIPPVLHLFYIVPLLLHFLLRPFLQSNSMHRRTYHGFTDTTTPIVPRQMSIVWTKENMVTGSKTSHIRTSYRN